MNTGFLGSAVATVLTVYGIETVKCLTTKYRIMFVATVLTVYGIETFLAFLSFFAFFFCCNSTYRLRY